MSQLQIVKAFGVIVLLATVIIFFILPSKPNEYFEPPKNGELTFKNDDRFEKMADTIHKYLDTSFLAEYRVKPGRYLFNYGTAQQQGDTFTVSEFINSHVFDEPESLGINYIWRDLENNYISFQIQDNKNKSKNIIVLDAGQDTIKSSTLGHIPVNSFSSGAEINIGRYQTIAQQSNRVYIVSSRELIN